MKNYVYTAYPHRTDTFLNDFQVDRHLSMSKLKHMFPSIWQTTSLCLHVHVTRFVTYLKTSGFTSVNTAQVNHRSSVLVENWK